MDAEVIKLYFVNAEELQAELEKQLAAIQLLIDTEILKTPEDIELDILLRRIGDRYVKNIKTGFKN